MKKLLMLMSVLSTFILAVAVYGEESTKGTEQKGQAMKHLTMEEIVVTEGIVSEQAITVVGEKTIEKGKNIYVPDVLKYEPEIDVSRRALLGDTGNILSIRGLSRDRIMVNINGRPINAAGVVGGHYIDWSTIPLDNIERIEVIKGGSSVRYGNNALGGVINIITKQPAEKPSFTFYSTYGGGSGIDYIQNYRATHSYKIGPFGYSLAGSYQKAAPFLWNNNFQGLNFSSTFNIDMPMHGEMLLAFQYANTKRGFIRENRLSTDPDNPNFYNRRNSDYPLAFGETIAPGRGKAFIPGPGAEWDKTKYYFDFGYKQPIADGLIELKAYKNLEDRKEKNYSASIINPSYPDGRLVLDRKVESDRSYGGSINFTKPLSNHELLAGVEYKVLAYGDVTNNYIDTVYNEQPPFPVSKPQNKAIMWGYFIQDNWKITDKILLTPGLRYDIYNIKSIHGNSAPDLKDETITPKLTATYKVSTFDIITASVYQALRTPGIPEVYWWYHGGTKGTPPLKAEKNNAVELTYQHDFGKGSYGRFAIYHYNINDYIFWRDEPNWRGVYNIDKVKLWGGSLDGRATITERLSVKANITYQQSKKEGDIFDQAKLTDELDYLPEWKGNLGLEFSLPYRALLTTNIRFVGEQQTIYTYTVGNPPQRRFKLMHLASFATTDAELKIPITKHGEVGIYAENLFDKKYEERFGYPMAGRIIGGSLKLTF